MYFVIKLKHVHKHKEQRRVRWTQPAHEDETNKERNHLRKGRRNGTEYNIQRGPESTATDADPDAPIADSVATGYSSQEDKNPITNATSRTT